MRNLLSSIAIATMLATAPAAQAQAAAQVRAAAPQPDKAYGQLYDAIIGGFDLDQLTMLAANEIYEGTVRNSPRFAELAGTRPGLRERFLAVCMPFFKLWLPRSMDLARQRSTAELAKSLTPSDARELAAFYSSPLGRKVIKAVGNNLTFSSKIDATYKGGSAAAKQRAERADTDSSSANATDELLKSLTPAELREFQAFKQSRAFKNIDAMSAALARAKKPAPDEISTPEERAALSKAIAGFMVSEMRSN